MLFYPWRNAGVVLAVVIVMPVAVMWRCHLVPAAWLVFARSIHFGGFFHFKFCRLFLNKPRIRNFPRISNKESETKTRESETKIRESETKIPRIRNQKPRESETKIQESDTKPHESETENQKLKIANQTPRSANQKPNKPTNQKPKKANHKSNLPPSLNIFVEWDITANLSS